MSLGYERYRNKVIIIIIIIIIIIAFDNQENAYYSSRFKSPAGIDRDAMRFQGLGAILLWLAHLASISHDKPRHCHETILDEKTPIERTYLIFDYY